MTTPAPPPAEEIDGAVVIDLENRTQVLSSFAGDMEEAIAAFLEKRPPRFSSGGVV